MPLKPDIFKQVGEFLQKHNLHEPDPEKTDSREVSAYIAGFREIEAFVLEHGRLPEKGKSITERKLASRLKGIAENDDKRNDLAPHDPHDIIPRYCEANGFTPSRPAEETASTPQANRPPTADEVIVPKALKDIASSGAFARIMSGAQAEKSLFGGRFANKPKKDQVMPDYVATRKDCADFDKFRPFFDQCLVELRGGIRKAIPFKNEQHIEVGKFYVLGGLLCYVADKGEPYMHNGKTNTRLASFSLMAANLSSHTFEQLIHAVFGAARLDIEITDPEGQIRKATEWFSVPFPAISHALDLIACGQIQYYQFNAENGEMEFRKQIDTNED